MKLSEAMRKGAEQTTKGIGGYFMGMEDGKLMACAMGAAWVGLRGIKDLDECNSNSLAFLWPELNEQHDAPEGVNPDDTLGHSLWSAIAALNDSEGWSREQIADWLEQEGY